MAKALGSLLGKAGNAVTFSIRITPRRLLTAFAVLAIVGAVGFQFWEMKRLRHEIYWLQYTTYGWEYAEFNEMAKSPSQASYQAVSQEVKQLEVIDTYSYDGDPSYSTKNVRILELEVTNTSDWVLSNYSVSYVNREGRVVPGIVSLREGIPEYEEFIKGSSFELTPGGKTVVKYFFEDPGYEITQLYDTNSGQIVELAQ